MNVVRLVIWRILLSLITLLLVSAAIFAIIEVLPGAYWQRCYVRFLRNALDYLPRKVADDCLIELRSALRST